ncbi:hypothetical protein JG687_00002237 [Phytophthora cactorum]|uniref:Tr-type G domain-containing protein n=1 Tax=Phytophthora cactorum TaxID=29920 RepID=A0A8T1UUX5_9STRA|nr:hypothetical protein JG687_00002237 [Phytophthora cactorum]
MDGSNPPKKTLSAAAKEFSFNPGATTWTPPASFTPPPPAPVPARGFDVAMPVPKKGGAAVLGAKAAAPAAPAPPAAEPVAQLEEKVQELAVEEPKAEDPKAEEAEEEEVEDTFEEEAEVGDEDPREHLNVVLIGHVDAGKSTLSGNLLYLMDMVDKRTIERYEREAKQRNRDSWFLAYIMDTGEEERAKGKTVERDVSFIPVSGLHGDNVKVRVDKSKAPWYEGESLIDHMDTLHIGNRNPDGPTRVPILDRYAERGTIALGKVESGILKTGQKVLLMPTNATAVVNQVYINEQPVRTAKPGENVTIRLSCGLDDIQKGFVICGMKEEAPARAIHAFAAQIALVDTLEHRPLLTAGYKCILHIHTVAQECVVAKLLRPIDPKTGKPVKKHVTFIKQGQSVVCRIEVEQSITIETFASMPQLGRLTLRDEGKTIAIGKVLALEK